MLHRPSRLVAALLVGWAAAACSPSLSSATGGDDEAPAGRACTLIGCMSGLSVRLPTLPEGAWRIEVTDLASGVTRAFDCPATSRCAPMAFLADFTPERARVRVITARGTGVTDVQPSYQTARPNGPDCPPTCVQGTVDVGLPE